MGRVQPDVGFVVATVDLERSHLNLLNQTAFIGVYGIQTEGHVMLVHMSSGITQRTQRFHRRERFFPFTRQATVNTLRLIDDNDGVRGANKVNRLFTTCVLVLFVEIVDILLVDRADRRDHDLDVATGRKITNLSEL